MRNLTLVAISIFLIGLVLEVYLRLASPQIHDIHPRGMYERDSQIGYVLTAGFKGIHKRAEFRTTVNVNGRGLRGPEIRRKNSNTFRILAIGDSMTWGWGVEHDQAWPSIVETFLSERFPHLDVQVLNGGVPGWGTDEELHFLAARGSDLKPDLVITMFFAGNDIRENRELAKDTHEIRDGYLRRISEPHTANGWWAFKKAASWLKRHSHLAKFTIERLGYLSMRLGVYAFLDQSSSEYFTPDDAKRSVELLVKISDTARALGAGNLLVYSPPRMGLLVGRTSRSVDIVKKAAERGGVRWIDLTAWIIEAGRDEELYYKADGHWTPAGHELVAQVISDTIVEDISTFIAAPKAP